MSVAKMPDGRWYASCRYTTWTGERKQKKREGFKTKREAQAWEQEFVRKMSGSSDMTMSSLMDLYLKSQKSRVKASTYRTQASMINARLRPAFGQLKCSEVTPTAVHEWHSELLTTDSHKYGKPLANSSMRGMHQRLSAIFNFGVRYYGVRFNPCKDTGQVEKPKKRKISFLTLDEFNRFLAVEKRPDYYLAFEMLFWLGIREGELLALTPADIREPNVHIAATYLRMHREDQTTTPKTEGSERDVAAPAFLLEHIRSFISKAMDMQPYDRIFESISADMLRKHCARNCDKAEVKKIRVHDLRHSHASLLINHGASPVLIAARLGHEKVETTLNIYSHLYPSQEDNLMSVLGECYDSVTPKLLPSNFDT